MTAPDLAHEIDLGADLGRLLHVHAAENRWVFVDARLHRDRSLAAAARNHQAVPANTLPQCQSNAWATCLARTRLTCYSRYIRNLTKPHGEWNAMSKPLEGIKVIEVGQEIQGPFAGLVLADMGASVIKIENRETGDLSRWLTCGLIGGPE